MAPRRPVHATILIAALALALACNAGPSGSDDVGTSDAAQTETAADATSGASTSATSDASEGSDTAGTSDEGTSGACGSATPVLLCDTMLPFYEHARALHEATASDCQLLSIVGIGIGPEGTLVSDVFSFEPSWTITFVCPGRRVEYAYSAAAADYPLVTEYVEAIDPSNFKDIEGALSDSPAMMELYAGTNCPDVLTLDSSRLVFQPSGIAMSTALFTIGGGPGESANITVDAQGQVVEIFPCP